MDKYWLSLQNPEGRESLHASRKKDAFAMNREDRSGTRRCLKDGKGRDIEE